MLRNRTTEDKSVFVTVGTTQFDDLIKTATQIETLEVLKKLGYTRILLQTGCGSYRPDVTPAAGAVDVSYYDYKPSIKQDIEEASLVISHAGAGSVLETLSAGKALLVIINEQLMGNHQVELAHQLCADGHLHYCTRSELTETLQRVSFSNLKPFAPGKPELFSQFLDSVMGFS
ncbi:hypothetical protein ScPMuIL_002500 [Solemya velum]